MISTAMISTAMISILGAIALGAAIGAVGGLFGIGGGLIAIPALGLIYGMGQQAAQGTALVMVAPAVSFAFWRYRRQVGLDLRIAATLALSAAPSTYVAARFATGLDAGRLRTAFAAFILSVALLIGYRLFGGGATVLRSRPLAWGWSSLIGLAGGAVSGLFGVGGAIVAPPALTTLLAMRQAAAQGLALALVAPGTIVALLTYARAGAVDWTTGVALAAGALATIPAGVATARRLPERTLRVLFCGLLVATAALLVRHS
jgi:uncharacterized membrane protein YfcA